MSENAAADYIWYLHADIGCVDNPVTFRIGDALSAVTNGSPAAPSGTAFNGALRGNNHTIHIAPPLDTRSNGVTGFIINLGQHGVVDSVRLTGHVQGSNIVGGLIGWSQGGHVTNNDVSGLTVSHVSGGGITGSLIGVKAPWIYDPLPGEQETGAVMDNITAGGDTGIGYHRRTLYPAPENTSAGLGFEEYAKEPEEINFEPVFRYDNYIAI